MYKLYYIIRELIRFSRAARAFLGESEQRIEQSAHYESYALRRTYRRILLFAVLFPLVCGVVLPILVPCIDYHRGEYRGQALASALVVGMILSLPACFFYLFAGVAVGCMLAPDEFMDSPVGEQWLELIGTKNRTAARLVCFVAAVAGLLIMLGLCAAEIGILRSPGQNSPYPRATLTRGPTAAPLFTHGPAPGRFPLRPSFETDGPPLPPHLRPPLRRGGRPAPAVDWRGRRWRARVEGMRRTHPALIAAAAGALTGSCSGSPASPSSPRCSLGGRRRWAMSAFDCSGRWAPGVCLAQLPGFLMGRAERWTGSGRREGSGETRLSPLAAGQREPRRARP